MRGRSRPRIDPGFRPRSRARRATCSLNPGYGGGVMPRVVKSTIIDAPVDRVWSVLRDFNGFDRWHPTIATSAIERGAPSDKVGCVRRLRLKDGSELREQLLTLSDLEQTYSYCLLDTPIPLFNYVAHVRLMPVTDGD